MKKKITLFLVLILIAGLFTGCAKKEEPAPAPESGEAEIDDQLAAIEDTKKDMESDRIMDRLICGDVGYGKTEIAIRAAFKAVLDCIISLVLRFFSG